MKFFRKLKARLMGTFLADCPVCHKHFYGNTGHVHQVKINNKHYRIVCQWCALKHDLKN